MLDLGIPERRARKQWPDLSEDCFEHTSETDERYNCVAWAVNDKRNWWEPSEEPQHYWPNKATLAYTRAAFREAFATRHFEPCADGALVDGYEKIAIYFLGDDFRHVAKQLADGRWSSKLGNKKDIAHDTLESLAGDFYGEASEFMRRPRAKEKSRAKHTRERRSRR